ncbi:MAG: hypothetical protein IID59_10770 [Proteobacteria bacterium]|nr:hypothetical protein [Pseudomonadota bacterium]
MTNTTRGIGAGLLATMVLSMIMVAKVMMGLIAPVMTLMLHVIYGAVLGFVYGKLGSKTTAPEEA